MPFGRCSGGKPDGWLRADFCQRCDPVRTALHLKRPKRAPEPAPPAYGRYAGLENQVPEEGLELDIDEADGDPMQDFAITLAQGK